MDQPSNVLNGGNIHCPAFWELFWEGVRGRDDDLNLLPCVSDCYFPLRTLKMFAFPLLGFRLPFGVLFLF